MLASDHKNTVFSEVRKDGRQDVAYTAYGDSAVTGSLRYNGERCETQTGCYLLGNGYRAYNPGLMRFHSPDSLSPFGEGGLNAYAYTEGDPVNYSDPTGHALYGFGWVVKLFSRVSKVFSKGVPKAAAPVSTRVNTVAGASDDWVSAVKNPLRNQGFDNVPNWQPTWGRARNSLDSVDSGLFAKRPSTTGSVRSALKDIDDLSDVKSVSPSKQASIDGHVYDEIVPTKAPRKSPSASKVERAAKKANERRQQKQISAQAKKARDAVERNAHIRDIRANNGRFQFQQ
jgi:RHS repeat-associated protein